MTRLTDERIITIRDEHLPSQGEPFDCVAFARTIEAELSKQEPVAPDTVQVPREPEFAWLIEWNAHGYGPQWWGFNYEPGKNANWCSDVNNAIRFARKEDAERMRLHVIAVDGFKGQHNYERSVTVTEHAWPRTPRMIAAAPKSTP